MSSKSRGKSIIAMKGHPFTRKSQFAGYIAASLKCPLLALDDFLDVLSPEASPQDTAFRIICRITKSHLSAGLFKHIVIDSPLSSRSHLDQLNELSSSMEQTRLVIIECKADNIYDWQTKFEEYLERNHPDETPQEKWYKAKNWEDIEKRIGGGYDERSDGYKVSKLVLDPISDYQDSMGAPPFMDAVEHMITRNEDDGPGLVVYQRWRQSRYLASRESYRRRGRPYFRGEQGSKKIRFCSYGGDHYIVYRANYTEEEGLLGYDEAKCSACKTRVIGAAYTCKHCSFALHKECAELLDDNNKPPIAPSHGDLSSTIECWTGLLLGLSPCNSCEEGYNPSSYPCDDCFFVNHLEERVLPTVITHGCDEHFLCVMFAYLHPNEEHFECKACGGPVETAWYSCKICGFAYHYKCLTQVPTQVEHEHGGHHHRMLLQYSSEEAEDYLCHFCFENEAPERRDPSRWFYSCQECAYETHLHCLGDGMQSFNKGLSQGNDSDASMGTEKSESWGTTNKEDKEDDGQFNPCSAGSGHYITNYTEEGLEYEAMCSACENQVTGAAYTCKHCSFALHKECAELLDDNSKPLLGAPGVNTVLSVGYKNFIQDSCRCSSCCKKNTRDSHSSPLCGECVFTTHLKSKMLPTVIRHGCHQHFLSIVMNDLNPESSTSLCDACGSQVDEIWYSCNKCGVDYDYECLAELAVRVEHEHHRQQHRMLLQYSSSKEAEDYVCDMCLERGDPETRDPSFWFYSCEDCQYEAHLKCIRDRSRYEDDGSSDETNYGD